MTVTRPGAGRGARPRASQGLIWVLLIVGALLVISLPTVIVVFVGMLPTLVASIVDRSKGKSATFCVGGMNFCGVFPWLMGLWTGHHSVSAAMGILTDPFILVVMLGAAAFGWMMFVYIPPVIISILTITSQHKVSTLREEQKKMIEEWGAGIAVMDKEAQEKGNKKRARTAAR